MWIRCLWNGDAGQCMVSLGEYTQPTGSWHRRGEPWHGPLFSWLLVTCVHSSGQGGGRGRRAWWLSGACPPLLRPWGPVLCLASLCSRLGPRPVHGEDGKLGLSTSPVPSQLVEAVRVGVEIAPPKCARSGLGPARGEDAVGASCVLGSMMSPPITFLGKAEQNE